MRFGVERTGRDGFAERRDRLLVLPLLRERDSEIEGSGSVVGPLGHYNAKRALRLGEALILQKMPGSRERIVQMLVGVRRPHDGPRTPSYEPPNRCDQDLERDAWALGNHRGVRGVS